MGRFIDYLTERIPIYQKDPVMFCREVLQFNPDKWQGEALTELAVNRMISIRSGQGVGKTCFEAIVLLWFLCCFPYARVVATAPTRQQLNDVLWAEVSKWQSKSVLLKRLLSWTKTRVSFKSQEERWFAVARTATKPENMQGFHEDNMLFIVDEASGVADPIMEAILGTLSGANNKLVMCGNPTKTTGIFYDSHHLDRDLYKTFKVSSIDSERTNKTNIDSLIRKFGSNSNVVRVRVYGEFPIDEDDVFIPTALAEQGVNKEPVTDVITSITIGVDVARFGNDNTVIAPKVNNAIQPLLVRNGYDTSETAAETILAAQRLRAQYSYDGRVYVIIDDTGIGGGVTDEIKRIKREEQSFQWLIVIPLNFNMSISRVSEYYQDFNSYLWGNLRELLEDGLIAIPNDSELIGELTSRKKEIAPNGKIKIESKDKMKKRGLISPDRGDAVALAALNPLLFASNKAEGGRRSGNRREGSRR